MTEAGRTDPAALLAGARAIGVAIEAGTADRLCAYLDAMLEENRVVNLTAVRDPDQALVLHAVDALALARAIDAPPRAVLDVGTGNGFPGVAAAVLWPDARVVLCDRTRKKVDAVGRALRRADLRAEPLWLDLAQAPATRPELLRAFDLVLARAVADPVAVARLAAPFVGAGGRLVLWLAAEERPPATLAGGLRQERALGYALPEPAARARALGVWRRV